MIYSNIKCTTSNNISLNQDIKKCLDYLKLNEVANYEKGTYNIDGDDFFVNVIEYETCKPEERFWEAHIDYIDVHVVFKGKEIIATNFIQNLEQGEYQKEGDFLPLEGTYKSNILLEEDDFLVCYPEDGHMTAIAVEEKEFVKKAVFKVKINK